MSSKQFSTLAVYSPASSQPVCKSVPQTRLDPAAPAALAMQDFRLQRPLTLSHVCSVERAQQVFAAVPVRYVLVENQMGDFQGILSASDVLGPRLMIQLRLHQLLPEELQVRDIMIPRARLPVVSYHELEQARVGDVLLTLQRLGQPFLCVQDEPGHAAASLRGILCARDLGERLGADWHPSLQARSFAELHHTLLQHGDTAA